MTTQGEHFSPWGTSKRMRVEASQTLTAFGSQKPGAQIRGPCYYGRWWLPDPNGYAYSSTATLLSKNVEKKNNTKKINSLELQKHGQKNDIYRKVSWEGQIMSIYETLFLSAKPAKPSFLCRIHYFNALCKSLFVGTKRHGVSVNIENILQLCSKEFRRKFWLIGWVLAPALLSASRPG